MSLAYETEIKTCFDELEPLSIDDKKTFIYLGN